VLRVQSPGASSRLLHSRCSEAVARSYQNGEQEADLGQVGRLPKLKSGQFLVLGKPFKVLSLRLHGKVTIYSPFVFIQIK